MLYVYSMAQKRTYRYLLNLLLGAGCSFAEAHKIAQEMAE
jgi:hypothetical protein